MIFCSNCGAQIKDNDNFCTNCGTKISKTKKSEDFKPKKEDSLWDTVRIITLIIFVCILMYFMAELASKIDTDVNKLKNKSTVTKTTQSKKNTAPTKPNLEVIQSGACIVDQLGTMGVCGIVKNNTSRTYYYAQIEINLYDNRNNLIASALDNINNIPPGGTWRFMASPLAYNTYFFKSYEIVRVCGW